MKCQGRAISITSKAATAIKIHIKADKSVQQRARNDPEVAASLESFGIIEVEDYFYEYEDSKSAELYVMTVSDAEEAKNMIKNFAQLFPELIDDDDEKIINKVIDDEITHKQMSQTQFKSHPTSEQQQSDYSAISVLRRLLWRLADIWHTLAYIIIAVDYSELDISGSGSGSGSRSGLKSGSASGPGSRSASEQGSGSGLESGSASGPGSGSASSSGSGSASRPGLGFSLAELTDDQC